MIDALSRTLINVQEPRQLEYILKYQINPVLKLASSGIICCNDQTKEFLGYFPQDEGAGYNSKENLVPALISDESNPLLFSSLQQADPAALYTVINLEEYGAEPVLLPYLKFYLEQGITHIFAFHLVREQEVFAFWLGIPEKTETATEIKSNLLEPLLAQLSAAVHHLQLYSELADQKKQMQVLLGLNHDLAANRDKGSLLRFIRSRLQEVLKFSHQFVCQINDDEMTITLLLKDSQSRAQYHPFYDAVRASKFPITDCVYNKVLLSSEPVMFDLEKLALRGQLPLHLQVNYDSGIKKVVMLALRVDGKVTGIWSMAFNAAKDFQRKHLELIRNVAAPIAVAVANIQLSDSLRHTVASHDHLLAQDFETAQITLQRQNAEKEILLSLSEDIAAVREKGQLLRVIKNRLKPVLKFSHFALGVRMPDDSIVSFLYDPDSKAKNHPEYKKVYRQEEEHYGEFIDFITHTANPVILNESSSRRFSALPAVMRINFESGIREVMISKLSDGISVFGYCFFFYDEAGIVSERQFDLLKAISNQFATAIYNIRANQEIINREKENELLISLSNTTAGIRDFAALIRLISGNFKAVFGFELSFLGIVQPDGKHFISPLESKRPEAFHLAVPPALLQELMDAGNPLILDLKAQPAGWFEGLVKKQHYRYAVAMKFVHSDQLLGIWVLFYKELKDIEVKLFRLLQGISHQLGIAVSNLIAKEKADQQLAEINMYKERLEEEKVYLKQEIETAHHYAEIIGESPEIKQVFHLVSQVAAADSTVLILGETGTGKELIARAIHNHSPRANKMLVKVNCAALPANLIESELFGHEKGSFTGATERRIGKFELANGGSLFLDEIGEMPLELQVKLLRALQEREIERVGGKGVIRVDVRIIAATNRKLEEEVREGRFRTDLYFRISTFPIHLPALRDRKSDIPLLATHFADRFAKKSGKAIDTISQRAIQDLMLYHWPGNIRELEHQIERSVLLTQGHTIKMIQLPFAAPVNHSENGVDKTESMMPIRTIDEHERELIIRTLRHCAGKVSGPNGAAALLGVPSTTLNAKIKRLGIRKNFMR
jgi:formate hydrogenlyase transcriptional activator